MKRLSSLLLATLAVLLLAPSLALAQSAFSLTRVEMVPATAVYKGASSGGNDVKLGFGTYVVSDLSGTVTKKAITVAVYTSYGQGFDSTPDAYCLYKPDQIKQFVAFLKDIPALQKQVAAFVNADQNNRDARATFTLDGFNCSGGGLFSGDTSSDAVSISASSVSEPFGVGSQFATPADQTKFNQAMRQGLQAALTQLQRF